MEKKSSSTAITDVPDDDHETKLVQKKERALADERSGLPGAARCGTGPVVRFAERTGTGHGGLATCSPAGGAGDWGNASTIIVT